MPPSSIVQFRTCINRLEHLLGVHYLEIPQEVVQQLSGKFKVRLLCTVNSTLTFPCGLVALGGGMAYISINNKRMKQLKARSGDEVEVLLEKDNSEFGVEMPEELAELLEQDDEGRRRFKKLAPGKQRYIIQYVSSVKSCQLRIDRSVMLIENLKALPVGKESFRGIWGH
ncbi:YdeI/OmpD-associated family protein [Pontibacter silvestris]|uniref:YdeI/OmpD-associated family protein n=1 Tax=Pontibacter silvestris TaxID=2305183 RepID=A0ABW4X3C4_9BACT|nr:YdeI/OmpD-associated family protein [Pontibacter silvestris]MCC9134945.1 YdeI/OmpD-associated family protein [Pontibacter silvestris]